MNFRLTAILFGTILVVGVVLLILTFTGGETAPTDALMEELVAVKPEEITVVEMEKEDGSRLKLVRVAKDRWDMEWDAAGGPDGKQKQPVKAKADPAAVAQLVAGLLKAKPVAHPNLSTSPAVHGLQPPGLKVTFRQGADRSAAINFGDVTIGGSDAAVFVTTSARPGRPMATPRGSVESLFRGTGGSGKAVDLAKWASDFRVKSVFAADTRGAGDDVASVTIGAKGKTLELERVGGAWKFTNPAGWGEADLSAIRPPCRATSPESVHCSACSPVCRSLAPADFVENPTPQQLKDFGLNEDNPDLVRVEIKNKDGEATVAFIGKTDTTPPAAPAFPACHRARCGCGWRVNRARCVRMRTPPTWPGWPSWSRTPTRCATARCLRSSARGSTGSTFRMVSSFAESARCRCRRGNCSARRRPPSRKRLATSRSIVSSTRSRSGGRFGRSRPRTMRTSRPGQVQAEVKVWADGFEPQPAGDPKAEPKPKPKAQPTTLIFGRKEADSIYVRRVLPDGTKADFVLPEKIKTGLAGETADLMGAVAKSRLDLLDTNLRDLLAGSREQGDCDRRGELHLDKDEKKDLSTNADRWTFAAPADKKGQTADTRTVAEMLRLLGTTQSVSRFVNEAPTPEQLIEYGFAAPAMPPAGSPPAPRLKVRDRAQGYRRCGQGTGLRVWEGNCGPELRLRAAARPPAVFTVPKLVFDRFAAADLRDRNIFRFDPAQVTAIELKGWGRSSARWETCIS